MEKEERNIGDEDEERGVEGKGKRTWRKERMKAKQSKR
jgi:hypothetical protein